MKKRYIVRTLACFSFVIFFCPFLQTCSNGEIENLPRIRNISDKTEKIKQIIKTQEDFTYNVYEFSILPFVDFELQAFLEIDFYFLLIIDLLIITSLIILYFSFKKNFTKVKKYAFLGIAMLFIFTLYVIYDSMVVELSQLKFGYYLFLLNLIMIIYFSNNVLKQIKN